MMPHLEFLLALSTVKWLRHLGGVGLILLGIADNSVVPMPGSMDVLTIWLAAHNRHLWLYYAGMATLGAVIGGYITYGLARKGGKEALERKLGKRRAQKVYQRFERWGFGAVALPAILPPPFPIVPFLLAAGAMQYSRRKFLGALALGRAIRFTVIAGLGVLYGRHIVSFFSRYYKPALYILIGLAVIGGIFALIQYLRYRNKAAGARKSPSRQAA
jgi:membrane protein YqaA with SNARE-associated domain